MMDVGSLRDRVAIQKYTEAPDSTHNTIRTWTTVSTVYANLSAVRGYVTFDTQQIDQKVTHKVTIRYYPNLTSEYWILMNSRRFRIRSVVNVDERNIMMELLCEEVFKGFSEFEVDINAVGDPLRKTLPVED